MRRKLQCVDVHASQTRYTRRQERKSSAWINFVSGVCERRIWRFEYTRRCSAKSPRRTWQRKGIETDSSSAVPRERVHNWKAEKWKLKVPGHYGNRGNGGCSEFSLYSWQRFTPRSRKMQSTLWSIMYSLMKRRDESDSSLTGPAAIF